MKSINLTDLVKHTDGVWARQSADEINGFTASPFYDSIKANQNSTSVKTAFDHQAKNFEDLLQLSPLRANLFRAFDWNAQSKVLEVGCGSGLISAYLSSLTTHYDGVEPDRALAQLAAIRTQSNGSARIISQSFAALDFGTNRYDVIIVCGNKAFLDYMDCHEQMSFKQAVIQVLANCKSLLAEHGQVFIAVDNGYGANYLIAPADQSQGTAYAYFNAGETKPANQSINLNAWRELLENNFSQVNEYYLFPDIYFSRVLLGRDYVAVNPNAHQHLDSMSSKTYFDSSAMAINESLLYQVASKNGYLGDVANGFLFAMSDTPKAQVSQLDFAHLPDFKRRAEYVSVVFKKNQDNQISRLPVLGEQALKNTDIKQTYQLEPYFAGSQLSVQWRNSFLIDPQGIKFEQYLLDYFAYLKKLDAGVIPGMNIDAIANNIIVDVAGDYHLIDHEWQATTTKVKSDYVFYRAMVHFAIRNVSVFHRFKWINKLSTLGDFLIYCFKTIGLHLSLGELEPFRVMDCKFLSQVMQDSKGYSLSDPFADAVELHSAVTYISWRFYNDHYRPYQKSVINARVSNESQKLTFSLPNLDQNIECFRFFPFEHLSALGASYFSLESLIVRIMDADSSQIELLSLRNSEQVNEANVHKDIFYGKKSHDENDSQHVFMFNNNDTFLEFNLPAYNMDAASIIQIEIVFRLTPSHDYEIARYQYGLAAREVEAISQIKNEEIDSLKEELDDITKEYDGVKNARVWRLLVAYRDSFKIGGYPDKNFFGKIAHMIRLFKHPKSTDDG